MSVTNPNEGPAGKLGPTPTGPFNRAQTLSLFLFVVIVFILLSYRGEVNDRAITKANQDSQVRSYTNCRIIEANATNLRAVIEAILRSVQTRMDLTPVQKAEFIRTYTAARPVGPDCGPDPR